MKESRRSIFEFNIMAPVYDRVSSLFRWRAPEILFKKILAASGGKVPSSVLDIGTGTGMLAKLFGDHARASGGTIKITGADLSLPMLRKSKSKKSANLLVQSDAAEGHLPFHDRKFDVVTACGVLDFIGSLDNMAAEMARVAGDNGLVAVTYLPAAEGRGRIRKSSLSPMYKYSPDYVAKAFSNAGIVQVCSETFTAYSQILPVKYGIYVGRVPSSS